MSGIADGIAELLQTSYFFPTMFIMTTTANVANPLFKAIQKNCEEVSGIPPGNTNEMGGKIQEMILNYYQDVRKQAQQSFYMALGAAIVGGIFYFYAAIIYLGKGEAASISLIAGSLIQLISAINFYLYGKAARQFSTFHICLERTNRFLLANTLCDNISCTIKRDAMRQELIIKIADAPMLTLDIINTGMDAHSKNSLRAKEVYTTEALSDPGKELNLS
jgi:hypothetical protein